MAGSDIPNTAGRKMRRRTQAIAKLYAFHTKAIRSLLSQEKWFLYVYETVFPLVSSSEIDEQEICIQLYVKHSYYVKNFQLVLVILGLCLFQVLLVLANWSISLVVVQYGVSFAIKYHLKFSICSVSNAIF